MNINAPRMYMIMISCTRMYTEANATIMLVNRSSTSLTLSHKLTHYHSVQYISALSLFNILVHYHFVLLQLDAKSNNYTASISSYYTFAQQLLSNSAG